MARRVRQHVNPLGLPFMNVRAERLSLAPNQEVEVEIGCADARFLFHRAPVHPASLLIGLEIRAQLVERVNCHAAALRLNNVSAILTNVNVEFDTLFENHRLARIYVNFPDPWFKSRHHKRRLLTSELAQIVAGKLRADGELFFQSDVFALALDAMAVLEAEPLLINSEGPWSFLRDNPYGAKSSREIACERRNLRIWRMRYRRQPGRNLSAV